MQKDFITPTIICEDFSYPHLSGDFFIYSMEETIVMEGSLSSISDSSDLAEL